MTIAEHEKANALLGQIGDLKASITNGSVDVKSIEDWAYGCDVDQCGARRNMISSLDVAKRIARLIMEDAARIEIERLTRELERIGIEP